MMPRVLHVCYSDGIGGASKAAYRTHDSLRKIGVQSRMLVAVKVTDDPDVESAHGASAQWLGKVKNRMGLQLTQLQRDNNPILHSLNLFPSGLLKRLNQHPADIINLHWVGAEMLSIEEIGKIRKPIVWTMHDMWAFLGTAHYEDDPDQAIRWQQGYLRANRPGSLRGLDLDRWNYARKLRAWRTLPIQPVSPSHWLKTCADQSALFSRRHCRVIHNPLNSSVYTPADKAATRKKLMLPLDKKLLLFGAMSSTDDPRKGFDILERTIRTSADYLKSINCELAIFGSRRAVQPEMFGIKVHNMGQLNTDVSVAAVYAAADCFIAPSRQDNLPNTVLEAIMCGLPVVSFRIGGLIDLVKHERTGYLAEPFEAESLAAGIRWAMSHHGPELTKRIRAFAVANFSEEKVANEYRELYQAQLSEWAGGRESAA